MKIKVFKTKYADSVQIEAALSKAKEYFAPISIEFDGIHNLKDKDDSSHLYEVKWVQSLRERRLFKVISNKYFQSLSVEKDVVGVLLFLDKKKAIEEFRMYGQETIINGIAYGAVFLSEKYVKMVKNDSEYGESYQNDTNSPLGDANSHAVIHEIMHSICSTYGIHDFLHELISEGEFDTFRTYLLNNIKKMNDPKSRTLYHLALTYLGKDVTPKDEVPDNVACAATVSALIGQVIKEFPFITGTYTLYDRLKKDTNFKRVSVPEEGSVLIYPTGTGNGKLTNGHVFICGDFKGDDTPLYSNDSPTGLLKQNYTLKSARARYVSLGGFAEAFFTLI